VSAAGRVARALAGLPELGAEALLVTKAANVRYLSGFSGEGYLLVGGEGVTIATDGRYKLTAERDCPDCAVVLHPDGHLPGAIARAEETGLKTLAFESEAVTHAQHARLAARLPGVELIPTTGLIEELRTVKDGAEVELIARAAAIVDGALTELLANLAPGPTEREIALDLERAILLAGADAIAFGTIVAIGPSSAFPHAVPGQRRAEAGQMVKIDVGCVVDGYCSDITRTVFLGEPSEEFRRVYEAVRAAQAAGLAAVRDGAECRAVDRAARAIIEAAGYGEAFSHGLGHGVGLEVHELPRVSHRSEAVLRSGMVVTIEPGVYIEGWGGVRIEDLVVATNDGARILTATPKAVY
jgi:Xaa-Pro aminopeptidase